MIEDGIQVLPFFTYDCSQSFRLQALATLTCENNIQHSGIPVRLWRVSPQIHRRTIEQCSTLTP